MLIQIFVVSAIHFALFALRIRERNHLVFFVATNLLGIYNNVVYFGKVNSAI